MTSRQCVRDRFEKFLSGAHDGEPAMVWSRHPYLSVTVGINDLLADGRPSYGSLPYAGTYATTLTRPDIFADYYRAQIERLIDYHHVPVTVGPSTRPIPLPFVIEESTADLSIDDMRALARSFTLPNLISIDDAVPNGAFRPLPGEPLPLSLFSAERVDLALQRIFHYTGDRPRRTSSASCCSPTTTATSTTFVETAAATLKRGRDGYSAVVLPGNRVTSAPAMRHARRLGSRFQRRRCRPNP